MQESSELQVIKRSKKRKFNQTQLESFGHRMLISDEATLRILEEHEWLKNKVASRSINNKQPKGFKIQMPRKFKRMTVFEKLQVLWLLYGDFKILDQKILTSR
jgi:hypothetical protein